MNPGYFGTLEWTMNDTILRLIDMNVDTSCSRGHGETENQRKTFNIQGRNTFRCDLRATQRCWRSLRSGRRPEELRWGAKTSGFLLFYWSEGSAFFWTVLTMQTNLIFRPPLNWFFNGYDIAPFLNSYLWRPTVTSNRFWLYWGLQVFPMSSFVFPLRRFDIST